jgi:hypothetical protein
MREINLGRSLVVLILCSVYAVGNTVAYTQEAAIPSGRPEPDFVEPEGLDDHVRSSDVVVIARPVRRLDPRVQTNTLEAGGRQITSTRVFARYLIQVDRLVKAPRGVKFSGEQVIEQAVGDASLTAFREGRPDLGANELMLFLRFYAPAQTFQVGGWNSQFKKTSEGTVEAVQPQPAARFAKEHPILGSPATSRASSDWNTFVQEVEALVPKERK